jgi:hypothetical protein
MLWSRRWRADDFHGRVLAATRSLRLSFSRNRLRGNPAR